MRCERAFSSYDRNASHAAGDSCSALTLATSRARSLRARVSSAQLLGVSFEMTAHKEDPLPPKLASTAEQAV